MSEVAKGGEIHQARFQLTSGRKKKSRQEKECSMMMIKAKDTTVNTSWQRGKYNPNCKHFQSETEKC